MSIVAPDAFRRPAGRFRSWWASSQPTRTSNSVVLFLAIWVLCAIGLVMVLSASSVRSIDDTGNPWWFFRRQSIMTLFGVAGFLVASRVDYHQWRRYVQPLLAVAFVLLVLVLIPSIGIKVDGARRWLGWGAFRIQPSELAKFALLLYAADLFTRRAHEMWDWRRTVRPIALVMAITAVLMIGEPDLASLMVITVMMFATMVAAGVRARYLSVLGGVGVSIVTFMSFWVPWRRARMFSFLDPLADSGRTGYQVTQSLIALQNGGWTGVGLGAGRAKWRFLPAAHTDFIFAVIGEELGLFGALLVIGLFVLIAVVGVRTAFKAPDRFGMILAAGTTAWIVGQAVLNLGGVVGMLPVTGVPLPFVSFGGTALVWTMMAAGLLVNVARQGRA